MQFKLEVIILTEGGENIGFGHITRCLSLYQAFEEKGIIPEFIVNGDKSILGLLSDKRYRIFNWVKEKEYLFNYIENADIVIIDSYLAKRDIYNRISKLVKVPVYIDDSKRLNYPKGIVVNGSIYAEELDYPKNNEITYLLGMKYALLRKEFWEVPKKEIKEEIESVMVTFGGNDMCNMTPRILKLLIEQFPGLKKNVVIGKSFKNIREIENLKDNNTKLFYHPDAETMKNIMLESDIAISAAGQTLYELARIGVPTIAIAITDNQINNIKGWAKTGFIEYAGWWNGKNILNNINNCLDKIKCFQLRKEKNLKEILHIDRKGSLRIVESILKK